MRRETKKKLNKKKKKEVKAKKKRENPVIKSKEPKCLVVPRGKIGRDTEALLTDFRKVMEPNSAKWHKNNKMKDIMTIIKPMRCSHMVTFSETSLGLYMKFCRLPYGPTLTFKLDTFSYTKDVLSLLKRQQCFKRQFSVGPCLMMNLQLDEGAEHLKLTARMFLDMFPTIAPTTGNTDSIQRCCLLHYDPETDLFNFRHYAIRCVPVGLSKSVKKLVTTRKVPNLHKLNEVGDFVTKGEVSESEAEDDPANEVTVNDKKPSIQRSANRQSAVRLMEIGPRLTLQLRKVEDGLLDGMVLYNKYVNKTDEEKADLEKQREAKKHLRIQRIKEQERNVQAKIKKREEQKEKKLKRGELNREEGMEREDDRVYFKEEIGEEPDAALFDEKKVAKKRKPEDRVPWKRNKKKKEGEEDGEGGSDSDSAPRPKKKVTFKNAHMKSNLKGHSKPGSMARGNKPGGMKSGGMKGGGMKSGGMKRDGMKSGGMKGGGMKSGGMKRGGRKSPGKNPKHKRMKRH